MLDRLKTHLRKFPVPLYGDSGQTLMEYALLLLLIVIALVAAVTLFGAAVTGKWDWVVSQWPS